MSGTAGVSYGPSAVSLMNMAVSVLHSTACGYADVSERCDVSPQCLLPKFDACSSSCRSYNSVHTDNWPDELAPCNFLNTRLSDLLQEGKFDRSVTIHSAPLILTCQMTALRLKEIRETRK